MLWSIRTRLALTGMLLVLLTAGCLMWFAHKDTIAALRRGERRSLNNILYLLERDLMTAHADELKARAADGEALRDRLDAAARAAFAALEAAGPIQAGVAEDASLRLWAEHPVAPDIRVRFLRRTPDGAWEDIADGAAYAGPAETFLLTLADGESAFFPETGPWRSMAGGAGITALARVERRNDAAVLCSHSLGFLAVETASYRESVRERFRELLARVSVQETGYAAVLDAEGAMVAGPEHAVVPEKLKDTLKQGFFSSVSRRVMVLPASDAPNAPESLFLLGFFRPLNWHIVLAAPLDELEAPAVALVAGQMWITLAVTCGGLILGLFLASRIAGPIRRLTRVAKDLPQRDIVTLDAAALDRELPGNRKDEVGELARAFGHMAGELHHNVVRLLESTAVRERMESELQVARDIQYGILPRAFAAHGRVDLFASMETARAVGGDLYDFFFLDEHRLCFVMGDVSDKSVPAALFMSMAVTLIRGTFRDGAVTPDEAMARVNDGLARDNPRNMFVTLVIAVLDIRNGEVAWASAGHMPPILLSGNEARNLEVSGDMMAGVFDGVAFRLLRHTLAPGEALFLYTDGVSEAMNKDKELFGEERLLNRLAGQGEQSAQALAEMVYAAVHAHAAGEEQSDDIAVMAVRYLG